MDQNALMRPWNFEVANVGNFTQPVMQGIEAGYRDRQQGVENERQNKLMGFQEQRLGMEKAKAARDTEAAEAHQFGKAMSALASAPPEFVAQYAPQIFAKHPKYTARFAEYGIPMDNPQVAVKMLAQQYGDYDPQAIEKNREQIEASRASTAQASQATSQAAQMFPYQRQNAQIEAATKQREFDNPADRIEKVKKDEELIRVPKRPGAPSELVYSNPGADDQEFRKYGAQQDAKRYGEMVDDGNKSRINAGDIGRLDELSARIGQLGKYADVVKALGPYANALGVKVDGLDDIQAFSAITSRLAPAMRPPGSGATSDFEFKQFLNALPQMSQTENGRKLVLNQLRAMNEYKIAAGEVSDKVLNGSLSRIQGQQAIKDLGNPLTLWRQKNPADPQAPPQPGEPSINPRAVVQGIQQKIQSGEINPQALIAEAQQAIASGKPREAVMQRLQQLGIDPSALGQTPQQAQPPASR